jgi:hypothetical protein
MRIAIRGKALLAAFAYWLGQQLGPSKVRSRLPSQRSLPTWP